MAARINLVCYLKPFLSFSFFCKSVFTPNMGFTELEDTVTLLPQVFLPALCVWLTPLVCSSSSLCLMAILPGALSSQCHREFKNKKGWEPKCIMPFPFPSFKPFPLLISVIFSRTLSNLSAKMKDIHFCIIITHIACSLALLPFLFVFYCIYLH